MVGLGCEIGRALSSTRVMRIYPAHADFKKMPYLLKLVPSSSELTTGP